jgi:hypothetical protein
MAKYIVSEAQIARKLKKGCGSGRGGDYVPWLTVREVSSIGEVRRLLNPRHRRVMRLLGRNELGVALDLFWCPAVTEVREQFPLNRDTTRAIAATMGVRHPSEGGVDIVMTTDFLVDYHRSDGSSAQVAICVKPAERLEDGRLLEKVEMERRYWARHDVWLRIVTEHEIHKHRRDTLRWLYEWYWLDTVAVPRPGYWEERRDALLAELLAADLSADVRLAHFLAEIESRRGWTRGETLSAFRHLGATKRIVLPLETFNPAGALAQVRVTNDERRSWEERSVRAA